MDRSSARHQKAIQKRAVAPLHKEHPGGTMHPQTSRATSPASAAPAAASEAAPERRPLRLDAELGIEQAGELKEQLSRRLHDAAVVRLDASRVERVHSAALQLLCLFCRERRAAGRHVEFVAPSASLLSAATLLGLSPLLDLARTRA
jgi:ABC-type transporter Mla MlaB component